MKRTPNAYSRAKAFMQDAARPLERALFVHAFEGGAVQAALDALETFRNPDGSWAPTWDWGGAFPEAWTVAKRWWRGIVTLQVLRSLRAYGCLSEAT